MNALITILVIVWIIWMAILFKTPDKLGRYIGRKIATSMAWSLGLHNKNNCRECRQWKPYSEFSCVLDICQECYEAMPKAMKVRK